MIQVATATVGVVTVTLYALTFFAPAWDRSWVAGSAGGPVGGEATESRRG